ncbi:MAG: Nif3-like dinuclear metal center hexameric protein [Cyclobacteriaceae bacterium]|nr:Nif3-like dinuclear metal center hexameric protein [Cyclobacteriaceae bacterium]MCB0498650.1 Nif3-like dinuclear metal center hexameric protein [Cyclobacteriaceae bacterium]MCB9236783.1 Nif3-like dinuclear metal center hexameric protein [Flammeovirgaceae bacterium]MCO5272332.1 Nif3-like dinuclear metal center hexameric protein [Cyclobacteriaceae bacterium]MCW5902062.1 Nif3-like dinuclear metal center hexameric protein [Cyclobacteriaceae bacterium]
METIRIKDVTSHLETLAPLAYQEGYDNSGLITGRPDWEVKGILVTLDCTEMVVDEAVRLQCNLIIAHHPIVFKGLKQLTGKDYVQRTLIKAIKNDIAIYAIHTNLDNVRHGVNHKIAEKIGLADLKVLAPRPQTLSKLVTFVPTDATQAVLDALHGAGAGNIGNYKNCSFRIAGTGTFQPNEAANPHVGQAGKLEHVEESRVEVIFPSEMGHKVISALKGAHPYEEVAYYLTPLNNENQGVGAGVIGVLEAPVEPKAFLGRLKVVMNTACIRHTALPDKPVEKVAICGGAGSFLLPVAKAQGADVFVSADFKYHEFFDADGQILIADIGHYESEQFTKDLLKDVLEEKFTNFAVCFSKSVTNPISYL